MKKYLIISQGSQAIHLLRELFSLEIKPSEISILTIDHKSNLSFSEFLSYYEIEKTIVNKRMFNETLATKLGLCKLVISFSNPFIISPDNLSKSTFINFHPGILPSYRGSLSTVWSMINGENFVGGTWHYVGEKVDQGNILASTKINIKQSSTAFSLNHQIFSEGIGLVGHVLNLVEQKCKGTKQPIGGRFYYNKFPNLLELNLSQELIERVDFFPPHQAINMEKK